MRVPQTVRKAQYHLDISTLLYLLLQTVSRAVREDLEVPVQYEVSFIRNSSGRVVTDRKFNTASLMALYLGKDAIPARSIKWNPQDPNTLVMNLPGHSPPGGNMLVAGQFLQNSVQSNYSMITTLSWS